MRRTWLALCLALALGPVGCQQPTTTERHVLPSAQETVTVRAPDPWEGVPPAFQFLFGRDVDSVAATWAGLPFESITLERDTCFGSCPAYKVTFYRRTPAAESKDDDDTMGVADLSVTKLGGTDKFSRRFPEALGEFRGMIHISEFAHLSYFIQKAGFFELQDSYDSNWTDQATTWVRVARPGGAKEVRNYGGIAPIEMWGIEQALDSAARRVKWTKQ